MLLACGAGHGNLLLNIGPRGEGSIPERSKEIIRSVGQWLQKEGGREVITNCEKLSFCPTIPKPTDRGDWDSQGRFAASGNNLFFTLEYNPGPQYTLCGLRAKVQAVYACGNIPLVFTQTDEKVSVELPDMLKSLTAPVLKFVCDRKPAIYRTGGMRVPKCQHPRYDPVAPDIKYEN